MIKDFETLRLNNRVLIDNIKLGTSEMKTGFIVGITKKEVSVVDPETRKVYFCKQGEIGRINLNKERLIELGFSERNMTDYSEGLGKPPKIINDFVINLGEKSEFLVSAKEDQNRGYYITLEESGFVLGTGYANTVHRLQNLISDLSDNRCKL